MEIKKITVEVENNLSVRRLFDMDVLDENGTHIERMEIDESPRTCLLCGNPAKECTRSRTRSVAELEQTVKELLLKEFQEQDSRRIAELACRSLLYEVCTDRDGNSLGTSKRNLSQTALGRKSCRL